MGRALAYESEGSFEEVPRHEASAHQPPAAEERRIAVRGRATKGLGAGRDSASWTSAHELQPLDSAPCLVAMARCLRQTCLS